MTILKPFKQIILVLVSFNLFFAGFLQTGFAQEETGRLTVKRLTTDELKTYVVREKNEAILVVKTNVENLVVHSTNSIYNIDHKSTGEFIYHIAPGTHVFTFSARGYIAEKCDPINIDKKRADGFIVEVREKPDTTPPFVVNQTITTEFQQGMPFKFAATVTDDKSGVNVVVLRYKLNENDKWKNVRMVKISENEYEFPIPVQTVKPGIITYYYAAQDLKGNRAIKLNENGEGFQVTVLKKKGGSKWPWIIVGTGGAAYAIWYFFFRPTTGEVKFVIDGEI